VFLNCNELAAADTSAVRSAAAYVCTGKTAIITIIKAKIFANLLILNPPLLMKDSAYSSIYYKDYPSLCLIQYFPADWQKKEALK